MMDRKKEKFLEKKSLTETIYRSLTSKPQPQAAAAAAPQAAAAAAPQAEAAAAAAQPKPVQAPESWPELVKSSSNRAKLHSSTKMNYKTALTKINARKAESSSTANQNSSDKIVQPVSETFRYAKSSSGPAISLSNLKPDSLQHNSQTSPPSKNSRAPTPPLQAAAPPSPPTPVGAPEVLPGLMSSSSSSSRAKLYSSTEMNYKAFTETNPGIAENSSTANLSSDQIALAKISKTFQHSKSSCGPAVSVPNPEPDSFQHSKTSMPCKISGAPTPPLQAAAPPPTLVEAPESWPRLMRSNGRETPYSFTQMNYKQALTETNPKKAEKSSMENQNSSDHIVQAEGSETSQDSKISAEILLKKMTSKENERTADSSTACPNSSTKIEEGEASETVKHSESARGPAILLPILEPANLPHNQIPVNLPHNQIPANLPHNQIPANLPHNQIPANLPHNQIPANLPHNQIPANLPHIAGEDWHPQDDGLQLSDEERARGLSFEHTYDSIRHHGGNSRYLPQFQQDYDQEE